MAQNEIIRMDAVDFIYSPRSPFENRVLNQCCLSVTEGEIHGILGGTGAGKTTLAQLIGGLLKPTAGTMTVSLSHRPGGIGIGYVFQYPEHQLFAETVYEDISYGMKEMGLSADEIRQRVEWVCSFLELKSSYMTRSPFSLSGGETRKVALAGVLVLKPEILILDEPTVGLDPRSRSDFAAHLLNIHREERFTMIIVTHDLDLVSLFSRVSLINEGRLVFTGTPDGLFRDSDLLHLVHLKRPLYLDIAHLTGVLPSGLSQVRDKRAVLDLLASKLGGRGAGA
ncbi:MAG: ATP-binding cassette domain-containing protein [Candidatus Wallbacteria bacterium]|nr:ATP-binding cassette domain-containing protein [Candidatus Wallbacteria bacterium]